MLAGSVNKEYKSKLRMLRANLKDGNNPGFRRRVLTGDLKANAVVRMESADMASEVHLDRAF